MIQAAVAKQLRSFGLLVGGIFAGIGLWPVLFRSEDLRLWALIFAGLFVTLALVRPKSLGSVYQVWMAIGYALGWLNTKVILVVIFYGLFTPLGLVMRLFGRDLLCRKFARDADTYGVLRRPRPSSHMMRQF